MPSSKNPNSTSIEEIQTAIKNSNSTSIEEIQTAINRSNQINQVEMSESQYMTNSMGDYSALENIDFFQLYNLPKFNPANEFGIGKELNYGGYVPIIIQNSAIYNYDNTDIDNGIKIKIVLPWKVHEISDSVSVTYSRKGEGNTQWYEAFGAFISSIGYEEIAKIAVSTYNAKDLNKSLDLDFILPLTNLISEGSNSSNLKDFPHEVRTKLGCLQGLVYPRYYGYLYPPLLKVTFGGLYRGFKGFLREVNIRSSEEMVDIGGQMFPLIITGSLKFTNVFLYTWSKNINFKSKFIEQFNLSKKPWILFGEDKSKPISVISIADKIKPKDSINTNDIKEHVQKDIDKLVHRKTLKNLNKLDQTNINSLSAGMQKFADNYIKMDMNKFDIDVINNIADGYNNIYSKIDSDQLELFNIKSNSPIINTINSIQEKISNIKDLSDYINILNNLDTSNNLNKILSFIKLIDSSGVVLDEKYDLVMNMYDTYIGILEKLDDININVDFNKVSHYYNNKDTIIDSIEEISNKQTAMETVYASTLRIEKLLDTINDINLYINSIPNNIIEMVPINSIATCSMILLQTELFNNIDDFATINTELYEKTYQLYLDKKLDYTTFNKIKDLYNISYNIDLNYINSLHDVLSNDLIVINGVI